MSYIEITNKEKTIPMATFHYANTATGTRYINKVSSLLDFVMLY